MKFGSVCSGIEAASVAWHPLGWRAAWLAEIEPFPSAVLAHHYPDVPNIGDMTKLLDLIPSGAVEAPDVFCGGTPCQAFSVAGLRKSLDDARGNLSLTFCEIANAIDTVRTGRGDKPAIIFWENVPGVLSTKDNAFGCFLAGLAGEDGELEPPGGRWANAGAVYGPSRTVAWRVLDAQYFGVAQRRRRVFVVASARADFDPAAVLFEFDGVRRDSAPSRAAGESAAPCVTAGAANGGAAHGARSGSAKDNLITPVITMAHGQGGAEIGFNRGPTLTCNHEAPIAAYVTHSLRGEGFDASEDGTGRGTPLVPVGVTIHGTDGTARIASYDELAQCLRARTPGNIDNSSTTVVQQPVAFDTTQITSATNRSKPKAGDPCHPLAAGAHAPAVAFNWNAQAAQLPSADRDTSINDGLTCSQQGAMAAAMQVRRLTPVECERLQGFPTVSEKLTLQICFDPQSTDVPVAIKCHRWQNSAWNADESASLQSVKTAGVLSSTNQVPPEPLAALHVRMHSVDELLAIHSAGRLIWSANGAGQSKKSLPPTLTENYVQELAQLLREVARTITAGKAGSPPSIKLSFPASSGAISAEKSGREMEASASDAMSGQHRGTFTTSDLGRITTFSDSTAETLCCFALHAIAGCIPSTTLPETFSIELTVETPYTAIPWRNKSASECPDGPRYKALGNSWAVPNVRWIGQRIQAALTQPANDNLPRIGDLFSGAA